MNKDDLACNLGLLIRLQTMVEGEARRLGIDVEGHSHAITDKLRDHKHRKERNAHQQAGD